MTAKILPFVRTVSGEEYAPTKEELCNELEEFSKQLNGTWIESFLAEEIRKVQNYLKNK